MTNAELREVIAEQDRKIANQRRVNEVLLERVENLDESLRGVMHILDQHVQLITALSDGVESLVQMLQEQRSENRLQEDLR